MRKEMLKKVLFIFGMFLVLTTTYAYSALATSLAITSEVKMRPLSDIRVNGIVINSASGATMQYESEYSKNSISSGFILPSSSSSISYRVHIDNTGDVDYSIYSILNDTASTGLNVGISGYNLKDVIPAKSSLDLVVTYTTSNPSGSVINVTNTFNFKKVYYVTYETGTSQSIAQQIKYEGEALTLTNTQPTKSGYTFSKWNTKSDGTGVNYNSGASYTVDDDVTLYARYNITTYNITYNLDGGTNGNNPSTYTVTTPNITLADATKANYQFDGWTGNGTTTPTKNLVLPVGSTGDKTFIAHFSDVTVPTVTITNAAGTTDYLSSAYNVSASWNGTSGTVTVYINADDAASGVKKIEYVYSNSTTVPSTGWTEATNGALSVVKEFGQYYLHVRVTDNEDNVTTVTTKKITVRYRVAYYDDYSKSTSVTTSQYYTGTALTSRTPTAVSGYDFDGWYSNTALTNKVVDANTSYTPTTSIRLYGKWVPSSYTISYATNNGTVSPANPTSYNIESSAITLNNPTKTLIFAGHYNATSGANAASGSGVVIGSDTSQAQTFKGWSGTDLTGETNTTVTIATGSTGNRSYTAHWTAVAGTLPTVTRAGYECGWSTSNTGTTIEYASGDTFPTSAITEDISSTVNLYAVCNPNTYNISYTMNGGPNPSAKPSIGIYDSDVEISNPGNKTFTVNINANNQDATISSNSVTATQTFAGWTSTTIGSNAQSKAASGSYAAWTGTSTTNTYFKNLRETGTVTMVANWNSANATLPTITKTGYTCGYATSDSGAIAYNSEGSYLASTTTNSVTLYAKCTINSHTLTINPNGGSYNGSSSSTTVTQNYGTTYNVYNSPTRTGYIFGGWQLSSGDGNVTYFDDTEILKQYIIDSTSATKPGVYNNKGNGAVTLTNIADATSSTGYSMQITTNGEANPKAGGFVNSNTGTSGAIYYHKIVAKIPVGYTINIASNSIGVGYGYYWLTSNAGTGDWETYVYAQYSGYNGPFSSFGHVNLDGSNNQSVTWYMNESTVYRKGSTLAETQASNLVFEFLDSDATLTARWTTSGVSIMWDTQGGTLGNGTIGTKWGSSTGYKYLTSYNATKKAPYYLSDADFGIYRTGYTFDGWYTAPSGGTQIFDATGKLNASIAGYSDANSKWQKYDANETLYARWIPNTYTVTYNTTYNGGTGTIADDSVDCGSAVDLTPTATKSGWTFVGWNTDKDATTALSSLNMGADDLTLYAIYRKEAITLTAHWDANGATLSSTADEICTLAAVYNNATQNTSCTVDAPTITRSGYTIIGFNTGYGDTTNSAAYNTSTKKLTLSSGNDNRTWYAITKSNSTLTAAFAGYNGSTVSFDSASCYLYNGATSCTVDGPTVTPQGGFSFIGYNTTAGGTSTTGSYSTSTNKLTLSSSNDARTWYTVTKSNSQYTGTFTIQDSAAATKSGGTLSCYRYNGNGSCNITAPTLTANSGYTAVGWNTTADSQTASYTSGGSISINSNKTFYSITYNNTAITITFNKNGATSQTPSGGNASTNTTITQSCYKYNGNASCSVTSPTITAATGYTALGYNTPSTATTSSWAQNTPRTVSSNSTYYAISRANTYTIKYYQGNNSETAGVTQLSGTTSVTYNTATNLQAYNGTAPSGWIFAGWTTTQNGTTVQYTNSQAIETPHLSSTDGATVNLYAIFKRSVKFVSGSAGATVSNLYEQRYNPYQTTGSITSVSAPLPTSISGWTTLGYRGATTAGAAAFTVTADGTNITPGYQYLSSSTTITLYGAYSKTLTVTYYGNNNTGGSTAAQTATRYYNSADTYSNPSVTISSNGFTRTNYTFTKWNTAADGTGTDKSGSVTLTANLNLYAQWRKNRIIFKFKALSGETLTSSTTSSDGNNTYTWTKDSSNIIYKAENGGTSSVYTNTYNFDAATINLANYNNTNYLKIVKTGYHGVTDAEWICDSGCTTSGKTFDQDEISMPSGVCNYANGDCTVYLKVNWTPNVCTITFDPNSGTFGTNNNNRVKTMDYGTTVDNFWNANGGTYSATRTGYHIDAATAWIKDGNTTYDETAGYSAIQVCPNLGSGNQSVTLKANWKINVCTINYSPNGGTFTSNTSNTQMTCNYGNATCTSDMRNCDGGYYSATRTGYNIVSGKQWINGSTTYNQDNAYSTADFCPNIANGNQTVTLNVNWTPKKVTVTFKKNGATSGTDNQTQTFTYGTSGQSFSAKGLSRTGYAQTGWNTNSSGTGTHYNTLSGVSDAWIDQTSPSITLYAEWNQVPSTSATVDMTISSAISTASSASLILGHPGYDNDGSISKVLYWTTCTSGTATGSSSSPVTANVSSDKATLNITPCKGATLYYKVQDNKGTNSSQKSISDLGKWVLFAAVYNRVFNVTNASMDGNNLNAWVSASGTLRNNLLSLARDSTQGQNTYSQTDGTTYTKRLYAGILGRTAPSNTEVNNWSSYTNYNKVAAFLDSSEAAGIRTAWGY